MDAFLKDIRYSARMFLQTPAFTMAAIAALALGIGTNVAIFSVINTVLLKPFAYPDAQRIVMFENTFRQGEKSGSASPVEFNWWRHAGNVQQISAYAFNFANLTNEAFPEQIPTMQVSADFFLLCGGKPLQGRTFRYEDDLPRAAKTAVLAYPFWQRHYAGDPRVIGKHIVLNGEAYEVVGVVDWNRGNAPIAEQSLGSGGIEIEDSPDVYVPFQIDPESRERGHYFNVAGRLGTGITLAVANAQLQASYQEYSRRWTGLTPGAGFGVEPLQAVIVGGIRKSLLILGGAVIFVLLIACANVANLLLARATARKREIAIRAALGAGRWRIARQLLTESLLLSATGAILGLALGYASIRAILSLSPGNIPRIGLDGSNVGLDWRVSVFTLGLSIVTGILFGMVPALQSSRADLSATLKESGNRSGTGRRRNTTLAMLVTTEVALAIVLLIGAALLIRTFIALRHVDPGFDARGILTMRMSLTGPQFDTPAGVTRTIQDGVRRIRGLPGVEVAAATCCIPLQDRLFEVFKIMGRPEGPASHGSADWTLVSPGYFETFRIPVVRGRTFTKQDDSGPPVVIINQALAQRYWPAGDPLTGAVTIGSSAASEGTRTVARRIIGVVGDVHNNLSREPSPNIYMLSAQMSGTKVLQNVPWAWVVRMRVEPLSLSEAVRNAVREASGGLPVARIRTMEQVLARSIARENFNMLILTIFGFSALLLAAIGIYGLLAYSVAQARNEIGIRLALGAESSDIRKMVVLQGLRPALVGVVCGIGAALGLTRLIASFLYNVKAWDPLVFTVVPVVMIGVALLAAWLPASRASRIDAIHALQNE